MQRPTSKAKGLIGKPHQIGTPGGIQSESPSCIRVSGNFRAFADAKIDSEIEQKSTPQASRGTQNRPKIVPGTPLGRFGAPRSVGEAPRERLGGVPGAPRERPEGPQGRPGTPRGTPRRPPERADAAKIDAESRSGPKKSTFFRAVRSRSVAGAICRRFLSLFAQFSDVRASRPGSALATSFDRFSVRARKAQPSQKCGPATLS